MTTTEPTPKSTDNHIELETLIRSMLDASPATESVGTTVNRAHSLALNLAERGVQITRNGGAIRPSNYSHIRFRQLVREWGMTSDYEAV